MSPPVKGLIIFLLAVGLILLVLNFFANSLIYFHPQPVNDPNIKMHDFIQIYPEKKPLFKEQ